MQKSLQSLELVGREDQGPLGGTLGQRSRDRCRETGGNIKLISHEAGYFLGEIKCQSRSGRSGFHLEVDLDSERGKIKIKNPGVTRGCAEYQYCRNAQKSQGGSFRGGSGRTEAGWGWGAWVWVGEGLLEVPPLLSARSWHRSSWQHGDGISRLKLADDW